MSHVGAFAFGVFLGLAFMASSWVLIWSVFKLLDQLKSPGGPRAPGDGGNLTAGSWTETGTKSVIHLRSVGALQSGPNVRYPTHTRRRA